MQSTPQFCRFALLLHVTSVIAACSGNRTDDLNRDLRSGRDGGEHDAADEVLEPDTGGADEEIDAGADASDGDAGEPGKGLDASEQTLSEGGTSEPDAGGSGQDASVEAGAADTGADVSSSTTKSLYVDLAAGNNANPGTLAQPLKTIAYAASLATSGDTIWRLDGTYDSTTEPRFFGTDAAPCGAASGIALPAGVTVRALHPGQAVLSVNAPHGFCMTGGALIDLEKRHPTPAGRLVEPSAGEVLVEGTSFTNAGTGGGGGEGAIYATGSARVTVRPGRLNNLLGTPAYTYVAARENSRAEIQGGALDNSLSTGISGVYQFDGTLIARNGSRGRNFWNVANAYDVKLRRVSLSMNGSSGLFMTGAPGSALDLGTWSDPGENTFSANNSSTTASEASVRLSVSGLLVPAVGDTWNANAQGADSDGHYAASGMGAVLES